MADCKFCAIIRGDAPAVIVHKWNDVIAIVPLGPVTDGHVLVIPRKHVADAAEDRITTGMTFLRAAELAAERERDGAFNLITSRGVDATQTVFHLHVHIVPRRANDGLPLPWTPQQIVARNQVGGV